MSYHISCIYIHIYVYIYIYIYIYPTAFGLPAIVSCIGSMKVHMHWLIEVHMYWLNVQGLRVKAFVVCCVLYVVCCFLL